MLARGFSMELLAWNSWRGTFGGTLSHDIVHNVMIGKVALGTVRGLLRTLRLDASTCSHNILPGSGKLLVTENVVLSIPSRFCH